MERVLYITANPKEEKDSFSLKLGREFINKVKENKEVEVVELDLYNEGLNHVNMESLGKIFSPEKNELSKYADEFVEFDKYVIAAPMWNLSIPSILKTYIDHITIAGKTFKYTENGPVGLLNGKKLVHITARGGLYSQGPANSFEMGDKYLRTIFSFMGIDEIDTFAFELTSAKEKEEIEKDFKAAVENIDNLVAKF